MSLLVPFAFTQAQTSDEERGNEFNLMIGRLRSGASIEQLNAQMRAIVARLIDRLPARAAYMRNSGFTGIATSIRAELVGDVRPWLYLLQAGVALVLLIACVNVANLLAMRAAARRRDLAVRFSLGASRWHIVRQLLSEGAVLAALGAIGGFVVALAGVGGLRTMAADQLPQGPAAMLPPAAAVFTLAVAVLATVALAAAPALLAFGADGSAALKDETTRGSSSRGTRMLRSALVVAETALAVVLLVLAGLLVKGFVRLSRVDPGFSPSHVMTAEISLPRAPYGDETALREFWDRLLEGVRGAPGVTAAGLISTLPLSGSVSSGTYRVVGRTLGADEKPPHGRMDEVGGEYFRAMGIPLVGGRLFNASDSAESERVVIVDRFLARREFQGRPAVGERLNFGSRRNYTIVGVVGTIRDADLAQAVPEGRVYFIGSQIPSRAMTLTVRTAVEPAAIVPLLRAALQRIDPDQAMGNIRTMDEWIARSLGDRRTPMALITLFGAVALALAVIGVYGVIAFGVTERRHELGIRKALGADSRQIVGLVFLHGFRTAGAGALLGIALSFVATRAVRSLLFGVEQHDPAVLAAAAALLAVAAAAACYLPARRAARVDLMAALREG